MTSTNDNCLGSDCPLYKDCFVVKARKTAMDADVVVVNHHLFLADMVVKDSGFGELIPEAEVMIFDEAHQLPDIASQYFGQSLSSRQLQDLAKDITIAYRTELKDTQQLQKCADRPAQCAQDFRLQLGEPGYRGNLRELLADKNIQRALLLLDDALELCYDVAKLSLGRSALLDAAFERATLYRGRLKRLKEINQPGYSYWYECTSRHFTPALTPLTVADKFKEVMAQKPGTGSLPRPRCRSTTICTTLPSVSALSRLNPYSSQARSTMRNRRCCACHAICRCLTSKGRRAIWRPC